MMHKGLLSYATVMCSVVIVIFNDSLIHSGFILLFMTLELLLLWKCKKVLTYEDVETLSLYKFYNSWFS